MIKIGIKIMPSKSSTNIMMQHIFYNYFIKYFLCLFMMLFCLNQLFTSISHIVLSTLYRNFDSVNLLSLNLSKQRQLLHHLQTLMHTLHTIFCTFSNLMISLHLSIISDTAFSSWEEGILYNFYFSIYWAFCGLCTNSSTYY